MTDLMEQPPPGSSALSARDIDSLRADLARAVCRICPAWLADRADDLVQVAILRVMEVQRRSEGNAARATP